MEGRTALGVFAVFFKLGLTSFGGPIAHLGYFRREFVQRRKWLSDEAFADLLALCQFLPGPASSQAGFAIGLQRAGLWGGIAAFLGFTAPSLALMLGAAAGLRLLPPGALAPVVHGLMLVAAAVVAHAVTGMAASLTRTWQTILIAALAFAVLLAAGAPFVQPVVIAAGAIAGLAIRVDARSAASAPDVSIGPGISRAAAILFAVLFLALPLLALLAPSPLLRLADGFYRSGALVFGGGHVVLPLLQRETAGLVSEPTFLAGYGAAQALPGPLFSFAAFLGAVSDTGAPGWIAGLIATLAIFLPGLLLVLAVLPRWRQVQRHPRAAGMIKGAGAAVVGVLAAALWRPVMSSAVTSWTDLAIALTGFILLQFFRAPAWLVVILAGGAGALAFGR